MSCSKHELTMQDVSAVTFVLVAFTGQIQCHINMKREGKKGKKTNIKMIKRFNWASEVESHSLMHIPIAITVHKSEKRESTLTSEILIKNVHFLIKFKK